MVQGERSIVACSWNSDTADEGVQRICPRWDKKFNGAMEENKTLADTEVFTPPVNKRLKDTSAYLKHTQGVDWDRKDSLKANDPGGLKQQRPRKVTCRVGVRKAYWGEENREVGVGCENGKNFRFWKGKSITSSTKKHTETQVGKGTAYKESPERGKSWNPTRSREE